MSVTATITSRGQLTLPKSIRKLVSGNIVELEPTAAGILIRSVESVAGSLSAFARKDAEDLSAVRETVWKGVADEKARQRPA
jgi:bifunctional DNA-binding transcriptional regulator/antitoxin component of YhaV-PrlF toxin-antitoxin module